MKTLLAITLALGAGLALSAQNPPTPPPQQQPQGRGAPDDCRRPGTAAEIRGARLPRRRRRRATGKPDRPGAVGRPELRGASSTSFRATPTAAIPQPASLDEVPLERWKELGVDGLIVGSVRQKRQQHRRPGPPDRGGDRADRCSRRNTAAPATNPRFFAHTIADEIHQQQRALRGVARTKLAFTSDRDGERVKGAANAARYPEHLYCRLRRREPEADHRHAVARYHARLVAGHERDGLHVVSVRASPTSSWPRSDRPAATRQARERLTGEAQLPPGLVA